MYALASLGLRLFCVAGVGQCAHTDTHTHTHFGKLLEFGEGDMR